MKGKIHHYLTFTWTESLKLRWQFDTASLCINPTRSYKGYHASTSGSLHSLRDFLQKVWLCGHSLHSAPTRTFNRWRTGEATLGRTSTSTRARQKAIFFSCFLPPLVYFTKQQVEIKLKYMFAYIFKSDFLRTLLYLQLSHSSMFGWYLQHVHGCVKAGQWRRKCSFIISNRGEETGRPSWYPPTTKNSL